MESYSSRTCFCFFFPSLDVQFDAAWHHDQRARDPTNRGKRQLMLDRQSSLVAPGCGPLAVATSLIDP